MDADGHWRPPHEWPEDTPPLAGWVRNGDGVWGPPPTGVRPSEPVTRWSRGADAPEVGTTLAYAPVSEPRQSRQAKADIRAMLLVTGAIGTAVLLLAAALILINQAGAADDSQAPGGVSFTLDSIADRRAARADAAPERVPLALASVDELADATPGLATPFDASTWPAAPAGCDAPSAVALTGRTTVPLTWVDQQRCEHERGQWRDRYLETSVTQPSSLEAIALIPLEIVHASGGWAWDEPTRAAFVADRFAPATTIVTVDSGHNPRSQGPDRWRPAREAAWCAYAVDWVEVKARWGLGVTTAERGALQQMLATCDDPSSDGPDPDTVELDRPEAPTITFVE